MRLLALLCAAATAYREHLSEIPVPVIYLVSFPGSGNTWLRWLIQEGSQIYVGSIYNDGELLHGGFPREGGGAELYSRYAIIKTHGLALCDDNHKDESATCRKDRVNTQHHYQPRVALLRHPCAALLSEFRRTRLDLLKQNKSIPISERVKRSHVEDYEFAADDAAWVDFVRRKLFNLRLFLDDLFSAKYTKEDRFKATPKLTFFYEELVADPAAALARLFSFLLEVKPLIGHKAPADVYFHGASLVESLRNTTPWLVGNALRTLEGRQHRDHSRDGGAAHWGPALAAELCAAVADHWHRGAAWWGADCAATCVRF